MSTRLSRELGLFSASLAVLGSIIGSAIFLVGSEIARAVPSPGVALSVWAVAGLISFVGGLIFAELGAQMPEAGGQYVYLREALGPWAGFLFGWTHCLILLPGTLAALAVAFGQFCGSLWPMSLPATRWVGAFALLALTGINLLGVRRGAGALSFLTLLKSAALLALACAGFVFAPAAGTSHLFSSGGLGAQWGGWSSYGVALIAAFWAFDGWAGLSQIAGEIRDPQRNIPRSTAIGIASATAIYLAVSWAYYCALSPAQLAASSSLATDAAFALAGPWASRAIGVALVLSTLGCLNAVVLTGPRVTYALAEAGDLPASLAKIHPRYRVPTRAIWSESLLACALIAWGTYDQLFTYVVCASFVFYALTVVSLFLLRRRESVRSRPFSMPGYPWLPLAYLGCIVIFLANAWVEKPWESLLGMGLVLAGLPARYFLVKKPAAQAS